MCGETCLSWLCTKRFVCSTETRKNNIESRIPSIADIPIQFFYDDFTSIDLRLKRYLQQKYFKEKEEYVIVFRVCITISVIKIKFLIIYDT